MSDIFQRKDLSCSNCLLETKVKNKSIKRIEKADFYYKQGNGEVLIILDCIEQKEDISKFKNFLKLKGINDYVLIPGIKCRTQSYELPNPIYKIYTECNTIKNKITDDTRVIITVAKGILAVTQSDDISSWQEFVELNFNQTYFYHRYKDRMIRVYPLPFLTEIFDFSSFENLYTLNQINQVNEYLKDYQIEKFIEVKKVIVDNPNDFLKQHLEAKECALDTETNSLNTYI